MEDSKIVEKMIEVERETVSRPKTSPRTTNINISSDGSTQVQEETVEKHQR